MKYTNRSLVVDNMNSRIMSGGRRFNFDKVTLEKGTTKRVIKAIWHYLKKYPGGLVIISIAILFSTAFNLTLPIILRHVIDNEIQVDRINLNSILIIVASIIICSVVVSILNYFEQFIASKVASLVVKDIRKDAFNNLMRLPIKYFDQNPHGVIMSYLTNDVETVYNALAQVVPQLINAVVTIIGAVVLMLITSIELSIVAFLIIPLMALLTIFISRKASKHFQAQQIKLGVINGIVKENITGLKVVKLYNQEENFETKFNQASEDLRKASFKGQIYSGLMMPIIRLVDNILYGLLIFVGALLNINYNGLVSVGQIQAMTNYTKLSTRPINNIAQVYNVLQIAIAGGDRVFKLINETNEYFETNKDTLTDIKGNITFSNVSFGYDASHYVLKDINFTAKSGEMIAIVGPTGSGKTTIINLLMRFYDPQAGNITLDGVNINHLAKDYLRQNIGIVLQTTYLFKGTVLDNIRYGKSDATLEEVIAAAKSAHVHEIIDRLPRKYETKVQEGGINFSHGERQLIAIARAILANPKVLILDEATSSVDTRTESNIQKSITSLIKNRTSFVIAHRLQTIRNANKIIVIHDGRIIEEGNHQELLAKRGFYYELYQTQFALEEN